MKSKELLVLFAVLIIALVLGELLVRLFVPPTTWIWTFDPILGTKLIPEKEGLMIERELENYVKVNRDGFLDNDYPLNKTKFRIAILGDSFVEAYQVPLEKTFHKLLEKKLDAEVMAFGVSGFGTGQELLMYKEYVKKYDPDLVILMFYLGNDVYDNTDKLDKSLSQPYFELQNGDLIVKPFQEQTSHGILRPIYMKSRLLQLLWKSYFKLTSSPPGFIDVTKSDYYVYSKDYDQTWDEAWKLEEKLLVDFENEVSSDFLIFSFPAREIVYSEWREEALNSQPEYRKINWVDEKPQILLNNICIKNNLTCVYSYTDFLKSDKTLYYKYNGHWNEMGHEFIADLLFKAISTKSYLK